MENVAIEYFIALFKLADLSLHAFETVILSLKLSHLEDVDLYRMLRNTNSE